MSPAELLARHRAVKKKRRERELQRVRSRLEYERAVKRVPTQSAMDFTSDVNSAIRR